MRAPQTSVDLIPVDDVQSSFSGGMRDRDHPSLLDPNQFSYAENIELREAGLAKTRRGRTNKTTSPASSFQGLYYFEPTPGNGRIVQINSGVPWQWQGSGTSWIRIGTLTLNNTTQPVSMSVLGSVLFLFSGSSDHVYSWDGVTVDFTDEGDGSSLPPLGNLSTVQSGRMCISGVDSVSGGAARDYIFFSDIFNGHAVTRSTNNVRVPTDGSEPVTGIIQYRIEEILAFTRNSIHDFDIGGASVSAFTHNTVDSTIGLVASKTLCVVGEDCFFLSSDSQLRTIRRTINDIAFALSVPVSYLVPNLFARINPTQITKCAGIYFDNYYLLAAPMDNNVNNSSVIVFDNLHQAPSPDGTLPTCVGEWTNLNVGDFVITNFNGKRELYYADSNNGMLYKMFDGTTDDGNTIPVQIDCRAPNWQADRYDKTVHDGELQVIDTTGTIQISYAKDDGVFVSFLTEMIGSNSATLPINLPFFLPGSGSLKEIFLTFYHQGRSRNWQLRINHSGGIINLKEITLSAWIEGKVTR